MPCTHTELVAGCTDIVGAYLAIFPNEREKLDSLRLLLSQSTDLRSRAALPGHLTGSAIVFDASAGRVLLIHHRFLNKWLQPGGHVDGDERPVDAARREVLEETGFFGGQLLSIAANQLLPLDIDSHAIPANPRKSEPPHAHHDFRYAIAANSTRPLTHQPAEVTDAAWLAYDDPRIAPDLQPVLRKLKTTPLFPAVQG